uniref:Ubiquitin thioesterase OTU n=2 Tax=Aegilops tauschii subsp. strangulata TaxID=200361 RepID=A0A453L411_AEGTS
DANSLKVDLILRTCFSVYTWCHWKQMLLRCVPAICLQRCTYTMYSQPSQLQGGLSQSMALWKHSHSHAVSYHTKMGLVSLSPKSTTSSRLQNGTCFSCLEQQSKHVLSARDRILHAKLDMTSHHKFSSISWKARKTRSLAQKIGGTGIALSLSFAVSGIANAEGPMDDGIGTSTTHNSESSTSCAHGKKVYTEYSVTGIPGDGRCLFRSVAHGECIRSGKPIPNENLQRKLADDLRTLVADEFIKRRTETEWFIEGDFDTYVSQIRKPHVWGGEPELLMASHVLQMPITVYMREEAAGGLIAIAEYGQEYGKEDPIRVLYHGCGHYEALHIPGNSEPRSRL